MSIDKDGVRAAMKQELAARVDKLVGKDNHQKQKKCTVCSKGYLGAADSSTCGDACRKAKSRG